MQKRKHMEIETSQESSQNNQVKCLRPSIYIIKIDEALGKAFFYNQIPFESDESKTSTWQNVKDVEEEISQLKKTKLPQ